MRVLAVCILLGAPLVVGAQGATGSPDLFSMTFAPGPFSDEVVSPVPDSTAGDAPARVRRRLDELVDAIAAIEQTIADEAAENGPQSRALIDHYRTLAAHYRDLGEPVLAAAAFEQASAVIRMNDGLHSLDQAAIAVQTIDMLEAVGAFSESDALQDDLLDLARRDENEADPRVPSILAAIAARQMEAVNAYLEFDYGPRARVPLVATEGSGWEATTPRAGRQRALTSLAVIAEGYDSVIEARLAGELAPDDPPELEPALAEVYALVDTANDFLDVGPLPRTDRYGPTWDPEQPTGDRDFAKAALQRARRLYSAAMQTAYRQGNESEYWALDAQFVDTYYFEEANPELASDVVLNTHTPTPLESVLRARVADRLARGAPAVEVARALLELGDALGNREALDRYRDAYDFLVRQGSSPDVLAQMFHPETPIIRRAFGPEDSRQFDPSHTYRGYIDVAVETGRFGQTTSVEVLDSSPGTSRPMEKRLRKRVSQTRFRPRFVDGEPVDSDRFAVRYYYDYDLE